MLSRKYAAASSGVWEQNLAEIASEAIFIGQKNSRLSAI